MNPGVAVPPGGDAARGLRTHAPIFAAMAALIALKLWLVAWQEVAAQGSARFDDYLFVELAEHIKQGEWLGPYTERTLVKGPVYPLWLAAVSLAHLPLLPAQHLLHVIAAAMLVAALRPAIPHRGARFALFAVLLFDPATYESTSHRVTREGIYTALTMLVAAGAAAIALHPSARRTSLWAWTLLLGAALPLFWFTREEGPWLVPAIVIPLAHAGVQRVRTTKGASRLGHIALLLIPFAMLAVAHTALAQINRHYYGVAATVELHAPWFTRAYGALTRVDPEHQLSRVPVSASARAQLYAMSPSFAELEPYIENHARTRASVDKAAEADVPPEEMLGTWFIWAFRDAVALAGHHRTLADARAYYERLAGEVNNACANGTLHCGPPHASLAPAWKPEYAERCRRFFVRQTHGFLSLRTIDVEPLPSLATDARAMERFRELTHMAVEDGNDSKPRGLVRTEVLQSVASVYRWTLYPLTAMGCLAFVAGVILDLRARRVSAETAIATGLLGAVLIRLALLTYISASAYPIFHGIYQRAMYPLLFVFIALSLARATGALRDRTPKS